jgi:apolipoprotein N-acyltransferase
MDYQYVLAHGPISLMKALNRTSRTQIKHYHENTKRCGKNTVFGLGVSEFRIFPFNIIAEMVAVLRMSNQLMITPLMKKRVCGVSVRSAALAATSGLVLTASFPKWDWDFLAWIALVPLFCAIKDKLPHESFKLGFFAGVVHYITLLYWISGVMETYGQIPVVASWGILLLLVVYLSLYPAVFGMVISQLRTRSSIYLWSAPFLWTGLEYIRGFLLSGFPWENLGYSQYKRLHLIQISDILGIYGLSAVIVAVNAAFFGLCCGIGQKRDFSWKPALVVAVILGGCLLYGMSRMVKIERVVETAPTRVIALLQGNIDQSKKWAASFQDETLRRYGKLSLEALEGQPDLMVWPETALPFYFLHDEVLTAQVVELVRTCKVYFVLGSPSFRTEGQSVSYYNSAYLIGPYGDVLGKYDKVHLVPYGEYVPFKRFFPFLGKIVEAVGDFERGKEGQVLSSDGQRLGVLICFEVIFPALSRAMVQNGAQLLVNITNDAWFGTSSAPYQHLSMAVFRAVETRRALARAANTGITAFIDPVGRVLDETPLFEEAIRTRSLPALDQETFYVRHGDLFAIVCVLISLVAYMGVFVQNRRSRVS